MPLSHFHHRLLQPLEGSEDVREGGRTELYHRWILLSVAHLSVPTAGCVGDRHFALHRAFHPADSRRHSARSLEGGGVLPETSVGQAAGDQREL